MEDGNTQDFLNPLSSWNLSCSACRDLDIAAFTCRYGYDPAGVPLYFWWDEIVASSARGCIWCGLIISVLGEGQNNEESTDTRAAKPANSPRSVYLRMEIPGGPLTLAPIGGDDFNVYQVYRTKSFTSPDPSGGSAIGMGQHIVYDALSDQCLRIAEGWLQECLSRHPGCGRSSTNVFPTRVIDVGSTTRHPRLLVSNGEMHRYAALSYRWGKDVSFTTTRATFDSRKTSMALSDMPKLFQDAIQVLRCLNIKYLWIDALCIIQDSKEDWERESSRMQQIYQGATLTIAADHAENPFQNLSSPLRKWAKELAVKWSGNPDEKFYSRKSFGLTKTNTGLGHMHEQTVPGRFSPDGTPWQHILDSRGWTLQERALLSRVLQFGAFEMAFECDFHNRCECNTYSEVHARQNSTHATRKFRTEIFTNEPSTTAALFTWYPLVEEYTRRSTTFPGDRLPAIQGLATLFSKTLSITYIAGSWLDRPFSLAWIPYNRARRLDIFRFTRQSQYLLKK